MCKCGKSPRSQLAFCGRLECRAPGQMPTKQDRQRISREDAARRAEQAPTEFHQSPETLEDRVARLEALVDVLLERTA